MALHGGEANRPPASAMLRSVMGESAPVSRDGYVVTVLVVATHAAILYAWLAQPANVPRTARTMAVEIALQADSAQAGVKPKVEKTKPPSPKPEQPAPDSKPQEPDPPARATAPDINPTPPELADAEPDYQAAYLNNPLPAYPMVARRMGLQGKVVLNVEVLESGKCGEVSVFQSSGHEVLDEAALQTVKSWSFTSARQGGHAVTRWFKVPIVFSLRDTKHE